MDYQTLFTGRDKRVPPKDGANHDSLLANRAQGRNPSYKRDADAFKNISGRLLLGALPAILAITSLVIEVD